MNRWILGVVAGAISLMVAVGCGGGDGDSTTVTLSKAEFKKQANAICAKNKKELKNVFANYGKEVEAVADGGKVTSKIEREVANDIIDESLVPTMKKELEELESLGQPAGDEAKVEKIFVSLSEGVTDLEKKGVESLVNGTKLGEFQQAAKAYGVDCSIE